MFEFLKSDLSAKKEAKTETNILLHHSSSTFFKFSSA